MITSQSVISSSPLAFGERPFRREPGRASPESDIYLDSEDERAKTIKAALDAGITFFHAAYEREAQSLGQSLKSLGVRHEVTVSTTDGDALDRCPDTKAGAAQAIRAAISRKQELLNVTVIDIFSLYDFRPEVHTPARLEGARLALREAQTAGKIRQIGATCYGAYDALTEALETKELPADLVIARFNYFDPGAAVKLFPLCRIREIVTLAAQPFSWIGGVPFLRFPNTWRTRNLTKNFYGFTAAQAHLHWILQQPGIDGVLASMQSAAQIAENVAGTALLQTPTGLEALFDSFIEAMTATREGWRGLLSDDLWDYRAAAETYLARR